MQFTLYGCFYEAEVVETDLCMWIIDGFRRYGTGTRTRSGSGMRIGYGTSYGIGYGSVTGWASVICSGISPGTGNGYGAAAYGDGTAYGML